MLDAVPQVSHGSQQFISSKMVLFLWVREKWKCWQPGSEAPVLWEGRKRGLTVEVPCLEEGVINEPLALNEATVRGQAALCTACSL